MTEPDAKRPVYVAMFGLTKATAQDMIDPLRGAAAILRRRYRIPFSIRRLWAAVGQKNPLRVEGSRAAGEATTLALSRTQRLTRSSAGGRAVAHGSTQEDDPARASIVMRRLQRLQAAVRRGERTPVKRRRSDRSRSRFRMPD